MDRFVRLAPDKGLDISDIERGRRLFRRRQTAKSVVISLISTLIFLVAIVAILSASSGWARVRETFFSGFYFVDSFPAVLNGLWINIQILFFAVIGVALLSILLAVIRTSRSAVMFPLRFLASAYTDLMRGIPIIILLYLIGFGIPGLDLFGRIDARILGTAALILAYSAFVAEVIRAGIQTIHPSQRAAARSLGLSYGQTLRMIVLPQALRKVIPPLMNDFVSLQKDVGLVSVLGIVDAVRAAQIQTAHSYNFTPYVVAALLFIAMSWPFIRLTDWYSDRVRKREEASGTV
jgi:polar amino acid transport system permease protein